jgi:hypothetical protein
VVVDALLTADGTTARGKKAYNARDAPPSKERDDAEKAVVYLFVTASPTACPSKGSSGVVEVHVLITARPAQTHAGTSPPHATAREWNKVFPPIRDNISQGKHLAICILHQR